MILSPEASRAILSLTEADVRRKGNQTGSVRFRSGSWYIKFAEWRFVSGEWTWADTERKVDDGGKNLREKQALLLGYEQHVSKANQLNKTPQGLMDLKTFVELRYGPDIVNNYGRVWRKTVESILRVHIVPAFGRLQIHEVRPMMVQEWLNSKAATCSSKTVAEIFKQLKSICNHGAAMGIEAPSLAGVRIPTITYVERTAYTLDQIRQLAAKLIEKKRPQFARFALFLALTGIRRGEALAMKWKDVDLERGAARAVGTWDLQEMTPGKSRAARRMVPLSSEAVEILRQELAMTKWKALDNPVWAAQSISKQGRSLKPMNAANALRRFVKPLAVELGMLDFDWHSERHSAVTAADGVLTQAEKQAVFGHSSEQMSKRYTHPEFEALRAKLEKGSVN